MHQHADHELEEAAVAGQVPVHQQLLQGIAGGRVVHLAVHRQAASLTDVGGGVDVHVADAVGVAHHGDARVVLDVAHQGIAPSWNHLQTANEPVSAWSIGLIHYHCSEDES